MRHFLNWIFYNASEFGLKMFSTHYVLNYFFRHVRFWTYVCNANITFWFFLFRENAICCISRALFKAHNFELKLLWRVRIRFEKKSNSSESEIRKTQRVLFWVSKEKRVRFRVKLFSTCQILYQLLNTLQFLNWKFYNASDFKPIFWTCVIFWIEYFTTRQILDWKSFQRVMFWINFFVMSDLEHIFAMQVSRFGFFRFVKTPFVAFLVLF